MPGGKLLLMMLLAVAQAGPEGDSFPCETLGDAEGLRIFDGIGPAEAAPAEPIRLKQGARLARLAFPLTARASTFDDPALATDGGTVPAMSFRSFLINGRPRLCTPTLRESVFGPLNADGDFLLRCLLDRDNDGRFESFLGGLFIHDLVPEPPEILCEQRAHVRVVVNDQESNAIFCYGHLSLDSERSCSGLCRARNPIIT